MTPRKVKLPWKPLPVQGTGSVWCLIVRQDTEVVFCVEHKFRKKYQTAKWSSVRFRSVMYADLHPWLPTQ